MKTLNASGHFLFDLLGNTVAECNKERYAKEISAMNESHADLLAALQDCVVALEHYETVLNVRVNPPTLINARAAIQKASE